MSPSTSSLAEQGLKTLALDPERIVETITALRRRIDERFAGSGLGRVCATLEHIGMRTRGRLDEVARPNLWLRTGTWLMVLVVGAGMSAAVWKFLQALGQVGAQNTLDIVQALESAIQEVVFVGVGLLFLLTVESRLKRRRALRFIRELRALAHIVDMHQLTKDPHRAASVTLDTPSSPKRTLTPQELGRYLDYCSEMLSLTAKLAALYSERFDDAVVLQSVEEVETLSSDLSNKIWQKIMILGEPGLPDGTRQSEGRSAGASRAAPVDA